MFIFFCIVAIIVLIIFFIGNYYSSKARAERNLEELNTYINNFIIDNNLLHSFLIIDSNIWMNSDYDSFFTLLARHLINQKKQLILYGQQFDEICNIKKKTKYGGKKNQRSRMAINRIDWLTESSLLRIEPITLDAEQGAYADPFIIKLLTKKASSGNQCSFLSDDKELRIRIREHLKRLNYQQLCTIVEMNKISLICHTANLLEDYLKQQKYDTVSLNDYLSANIRK